MANARVLIGDFHDVTGGALYVDLPTLVDGRALITGNSGAGKSRLLRRLVEQAFGKVQIIVLDPEGEFSTLREKHGFVLAGRGGEMPAEPRAAALMARRLMDLQASAVLDLYDLKIPQQREFARIFFESLMELPRDQYRPVLVVVDEAQRFCPERGSGEAESTEAMIALMTQGRKRGLCGIPATQRLSMLHKDAAAQATNNFIGRTTLDVDQKRAAAVLGITVQAEKVALRDLPLGVFLAYGPALSVTGVARFRGGDVYTTHPKAGQRHTLRPTATPEAIQKLAAELKDLPQQAAEEIRTLQAAQAKVRDLERELRAAKKAQPVPAPTPQPKVVEKLILKDAQIKRLEAAVERMDAARDRLAQAQQVVMVEAGGLRTAIVGARANPAPPPGPRVPAPPRAPKAPTPASSGNGDARLAGGERKILTALAQYPDGRSKKQVALLTGYAIGGGGFNNYLGALRSRGLLGSGRGEDLAITAAGLEALGNYDPLPAGPKLVEHWLHQLGKAERSILQFLVDCYPQYATKEEIAAGAGYEPGGGGFNNALGRLRTLELIEGRGEVRASGELFEEGP